jgi:fumarate hydratase class II
MRDIPIGIDATGSRTETDAMGAIEVPADRYWRAQTQRSLRINQCANESVMLVTALSPVIGYDKAPEIAHTAMAEDLTLRDAAIRSSAVAGKDFDLIVDPANMVGTGLAGS